MASAPEGSGGPGRQQSLVADVPLQDVQISVDLSLRRATRRAVLEAAELLKGVPSTVRLDRRLRRVAAELAEHTEPNEVVMEVAPGPERGIVNVTFKANEGSEASLDCGLGEPPSSMVLAKVEHHENSITADGFVQAGTDAWGLGLRFMLPQPWGLRFQPRLDLGSRYVNRLSLATPYDEQSLALSLQDPSGRHQLRLAVAPRELRPGDKASDAVVGQAMQSIKASLGYRFFSESAKELKYFAAECAGLLGDVSLARLEGLWQYKQPLPQGGLLTCHVGSGFALPLGRDGVAATRLEDRFLLGGAIGGPGDRLPGFRCGGAGPTAARASGRAERSSPEHDHLGGDARASGGVLLQWPLPLLPPIWGSNRLQGFLFGSLGALAPAQRAPFNFSTYTRASVGLGIALPLPSFAARGGDGSGGLLGISFAQPMLEKPTDALQRLQLWISFSSLL